MRQGTGEFAIRVGLSEQNIGLGLEGLHGIGAGSEAGWRLFEPGKMKECVGELGRVAPLPAVHAAPGGDDLSGLLGVVVDVGFGAGQRREIVPEIGDRQIEIEYGGERGSCIATLGWLDPSQNIGQDFQVTATRLPPRRRRRRRSHRLGPARASGFGASPGHP
jgi:hypothetical protein